MVSYRSTFCSFFRFYSRWLYYFKEITETTNIYGDTIYSVESDDTTSVFGFGLCGDQWTFAGRKPIPRVTSDKEAETAAASSTAATASSTAATASSAAATASSAAATASTAAASSTGSAKQVAQESLMKTAPIQGAPAVLAISPAIKK